jgi:hypothetical protein
LTRARLLRDRTDRSGFKYGRYALEAVDDSSSGNYRDLIALLAERTKRSRRWRRMIECIRGFRREGYRQCGGVGVADWSTQELI